MRKLPVEIKSLQGTVRKCRENAQMVELSSMTIDDAMKSSVAKTIKDDETLNAFKYYCELLQAANMLKAQYLTNISLYAHYTIEYRRACENSEGSEFSELHDDAGEVCGFVKNPWLERKDTAAKYILAIGAQFGFDAISHQKIRPDERKDGVPKTILDAMQASAAQVVDYYEIKPTKDGKNDGK